MVIDRERIVAAIREAEKRTSGEIRVSIAPLFWGSARKAAERAFLKLGMRATRERNAVLFFLVPSRKQCVLWGDTGIHEKVGQAFWESTVREAVDRFKGGDFTDGLVSAIGAVGERLALHFPYDPANDENELPDELA